MRFFSNGGDFPFQSANKQINLFLIPTLLEICDIPSEVKQKLQIKLSSQSERDLKSLTKELNKKLFHLVSRYQIERKDNNKNDESSLGTIGAYDEFIRNEVRNVIKKYIHIIESNIEMQPNILVLLVKKGVQINA